MTDIGSLKAQGGIDLTYLQVGTKLYIETTTAVYCLTVMCSDHGLVTVESSRKPFKAGKPELAVLVRSDWDDKGQVTIPHWIGRAMRMVFNVDGVLYATGSVETAMVESADGSWKYELWESPNYDLTTSKL